MKDFLLLFRGGNDMTAMRESPENYQQHLVKWKAWMEALGKQGKFLGGQPLSGEARVISGSKKVVTDGPYVEGKEIIGGYLLVRAADMKEAVRLSSDCPIFEADGIVEVREIRELEA
ncbi:MAG TPA: YciI family protein [Bacteroidota bacterium]|nr:YciI family protein [Bacteroidota bacterium]